jgi:hypothetical protein
MLCFNHYVDATDQEVRANGNQRYGYDQNYS